MASSSQSDKSGNVSRRNFLTASALTGGAATAGIATQAFGATPPELDIPSIRIPNDITKSLAEEEHIGKFVLTLSV